MKTRTTVPCVHFYHNPVWTINWQQGLTRVKKHSIQKLCKKYRSILHTVLAATAIACVFLGGAYLFLVQLAEFGW